MIVRSNFGKEFAYYIPHKFEESKEWKSSGNHLAFYWINGDQIVTVTNSENNYFKSNDECFIWTFGMGIENNRNKLDHAWLRSSYWSGILVGTDEYPTLG